VFRKRSRDEKGREFGGVGEKVQIHPQSFRDLKFLLRGLGNKSNKRRWCAIAKTKMLPTPASRIGVFRLGFAAVPKKTIEPVPIRGNLSFF
jgi:hypothetical protein